MNFVYVPLMAAKKGEFSALKQLPSSVANRTFPLFELPGRKKDAVQVEKTIANTALSAGKVWGGRGAYLDISKWKPNERTESRIHVLEFAFHQFQGAGVEVAPVVGYDRWGDPVYKRALRNIVSSGNVVPCIRIDRESIREDVPDVDYFGEQINGILEDLSLSAEQCPVILDFEGVASLAVPSYISHADNAINVLRGFGFETIIVAGGSMPSAVNEAVEAPDTEGCIPRIEMMGWKAISAERSNSRVIFGDYLIRCPSAVDGVIAPHANAKIRYTIANQFFIVRGHSKMFDSLTLQNRDLAKKLVASRHYVDPKFSWGDSEIMNCAVGTREIRDPTTMIAIDSNHHIMAVVDEIFEHQRVVSHMV